VLPAASTQTCYLRHFDASNVKFIGPDPTPNFCHDPALFAEFRRRYRAELSTNNQAVAQIATIAQQHDITLLYAAKDAEGNHAIVLAQFLRDQGVGD
jgi:uncharacterized protein YeaO (DUF488 family)